MKGRPTKERGRGFVLQPAAIERPVIERVAHVA